MYVKYRHFREINVINFVSIIFCKIVISLFKACLSQPALPLSTYSNTPTETRAVCHYQLSRGDPSQQSLHRSPSPLSPTLLLPTSLW